MRIVRDVRANRRLHVLSLLGLLALASGCDSGSTNAPQVGTAADTQAKQESEAAARRAAFGGKTIQTKQVTKR
jgi:hypothetical protein